MPGSEILADVLDPPARRQLLGADRVFEPHLGDDGDVIGELAYVAGLFRVRHRDRPVRYLDVPTGVLMAELPEIVEPALQHVLLEERAAEVESDVLGAQDLDLRAQVAGHHRGAPAALDEIDVLGRGRHQVGEIPQRDPAVDHHRESGVTGLTGPARQVQYGLIHLLSLTWRMNRRLGRDCEMPLKNGRPAGTLQEPLSLTRFGKT